MSRRKIKTQASKQKKTRDYSPGNILEIQAMERRAKKRNEIDVKVESRVQIDRRNNAVYMREMAEILEITIGQLNASIERILNKKRAKQEERKRMLEKISRRNKEIK